MQTKTDTVQGRQEEEGGWGGRGRGVWTHDRNISNRYMLSTSDKDYGAAALEREVVVVTGQSLAASQNCSQSQGRVPLGASGDLRSPCVASALRIFTLWRRMDGGRGG